MTNSTWKTSVSGDWSNAADWTGGVPNSSTATATISIPGTYTVTIGSGESFAVGSVTLNNASATLELDGTLNLTQTFTLTAGSVHLDGTINGGTIVNKSNGFSFSGGTLNEVTFQGTIDLSGFEAGLSLVGSPTLTGAGGVGAGTINDTGTYSQLALSGTETIDNATINLGSGNGSAIVNTGGGVVTFGSKLTITHSGGNAYVGFFPPLGEGGDGTIVNDGSIVAGFSGGGFAINTTAFTNAGSIAVSNGDWVAIGSTTSFSNTGTISVDGTSTIIFNDGLTTAQLGTVNAASGATLDFAGTLDNTGATYNTVAGTHLGGTIKGGTIAGTIDLSGNGASLALIGSPTLKGAGGVGAGTINDTGINSYLLLSGTETIDNATINLGNSGYPGSAIFNSGGGVVTFGSKLKINQSDVDAYVGSAPYLGIGSGTIVNDGSIVAGVSGGSFTIDPTAFTNAGSIAVSNGDTVTIGGATSFSNTGTVSVDGTSTIIFNDGLTTAQLGTVNAASGATLDFAGTLDNTGATYNTVAGTHLGGTIMGGTIDGTIDLSGNGASLALIGSPTLKGAGGVGAGTINDTGINSYLLLSGTETIDNATINLGNSGYPGSAIFNSGGGVVTFGSKLKINQSDVDAYVGSAPYLGIGSGTIVNDGSIVAGVSGGSFTIDPTAFTNAGSIAVSNGDTVTIGGATSFSNTGTVSVDGTSTIIFNDGLTTAQLGTVNAASGATLDFAGTLDNTGATYNTVAGTHLGGTIMGGTIDGTIDLSGNGASLALIGSPTLKGAGGVGAGTINDTGINSYLLLSGTETIDNATINLGNSGYPGSAIFNSGGGVVTFGSKLKINQSDVDAYVGSAPYLGIGSGTIVNDGSIVAGVSGGSFTIDPTAFTNAGSIAVSNGDTVTIGGATSFSNTGTVSVDGTSTIIFNDGLTTAQLGTVNAASGATLDFAGTLDNTGATYNTVAGTHLGGTIMGGTIDGTIDLSGNGASLALIGSPTLKGAGGVGAGTINDTGINSYLLLSGTETIDNATINLGNSGYPGSAIFNSGGGVVTFGSKLKINQSDVDAYVGSAPYLGIGSGTIVNDGSIVAGVSGGSFTIDPTAFTNAGSIAVSNGDTVTIGGATSFSNTGTVSVDGTSTIIFNDGLTTAQLGTVNAASGATLDFAGTLDNTGATYNTVAGTHLGGTIMGGTIDGTIDLSGNGASLALIGSPTLKGAGGVGAGTINDTGINSYLLLSGTETIDNATINLGNGGGYSTSAIINSGGGVVTFGPKLTIKQSDVYANVGYSPYYGGGTGTIVNDGSIVAGFSGGNFTIELTAFTNAGTIAVSNGDTVSVGDFGVATSFSNTGTISVSGGGTFYTGANFTNLSGSTLTKGSYEADAGSTIELLVNTKIVTDSATIILNGAGSTIESYNTTTSQEVAIDATLTAIGAAGVLELLGGRGFASTAVISNAGLLQLAGGTFTAAQLKDAAGSTLSGYGTVAAALTNSGTASAQGGTLTLQNLTNLSGTTLTSGTYAVAAGSILQLANNSKIVTLKAALTLTGAGSTVQALNTTTSSQVTVESTLTTIATTGALNILGGRNYTTTNMLSYAGALQLGGGTLTATGLTDAAGATLSGFGTVAAPITSVAKITATGGTLAFDGTGDSFSGAIGGTGTLAFTGGTDAINSGATIASAAWSISGGTTTLNENLSYAGIFSDGAGATLVLGANTLSLSGAGSSLAGALSGTGELSLTGGSQALNSGFGLGGIATWMFSGNAATSLNTNLTYSGTLTEGAANLAVAVGDTLTLEGTSSLAGTVSGAGTLAFVGGSATLNGAILSVANVALSGGASLSVTLNASSSGAVTQAAGTTLTLSAKTLTLTGAGSSLAGSVTGTGTLTFNGGSQALNTGLSLAVSNWTLLNADTATLNLALTYGGSFTAAGTSAAAQATVLLNGKALTLNGASSLSAATIGGTSTLTTNGAVALKGSLAGSFTVGGTVQWTNNGTVTATGGLVLGNDTTKKVVVTNSATGVYNLAAATGMTLGGASTSLFKNAGLLEKTVDPGVSHVGVSVTSTGTVTAATGRLEFDGATNAFYGTIGGAGTVSFGNGSVNYLTTGASVSVGSLSVLNPTTKLVLQTNIAYAGSFSNAGIVNLGTNKLTLSGGGILGNIVGTGTLDLAAGTYSVANAIGTSSWIVGDGVTMLPISSTTSYYGTFTAGAATLGLTGKTLDLFGPAASLTGTMIDSGILQTKGTTTVAGLTLGGALSWSNYGTVTEAGSVTIGDASGGTATIVNRAGATYDLAGDVGITPIAGGSGSFTNAGLLEKTAGTGTGVVGLSVSNTATVAADSGTLDITGAITGTGNLNIAGSATLQLDGSTAATQKVNFSGAGETLALTSPGTFKAPIAGFAAGDFLDLTTFDPTQTTVGFVENAANTQGTLTVTEGSTHINFTLLGQYAAAGFQTQPDQGAGTDIIYSPPPAPMAMLFTPHG